MCDLGLSPKHEETKVILNQCHKGALKIPFITSPRAMKSTQPKRNWIPLPDPIRESEVKLELAWSGDERTAKAIERQAALMGFESPNDYLHQLIAATWPAMKTIVTFWRTCRQKRPAFLPAVRERAAWG